MNIGKAAARSGVSAKMVRHYKSLGLSPRVACTEAGYPGAATTRCTRCASSAARDLGLSMAEIAALLKLWQNRRRASADVRHIAQRHEADLKRRIAALDSMKRTLQHLIHGCHGDERPDCPILDELAHD